MSDVVYPPVIAAAKLMFRVMGLRINVVGAENVPAEGGAVIACNHISYLDFIFCGYAARPSRRLVRFMAKKSVFDNRVSGPLMRGMHHIPVDREAGLASYRQALAALKDGEVVGVFPEATISRSFTIKDIKSGAVRMAATTGVPIIPMALWGSQRLWTKGRPRSLTRRHVPITIIAGEPFVVGRRDDGDAATDELRRQMSTLLGAAQKDYPDQPDGPDDAWWLPAHLGGAAPTPEEAAALDATPPGTAE
jgi:1-acyl-sn-glycerol-3-phosphate acyltransferase